MRQFSFDDEVDDEQQRQLLSYWRSKRVGGKPPPRAAIDPIELRGLLPIVGLIDVERLPDRLRFRYRLIGGYMVDMFGENFAGTYADESKHGAYGRYLHDLYSDATENMRPIYSESAFGYRGKGGGTDRSYLLVKRLLLPLVEDGQADQLLFSNKFVSMNDRRLSQPYRQDDLLTVNELGRFRE